MFAINDEHDGKVDKTSLLVGRVLELQKLHIRTVSFFSYSFSMSQSYLIVGLTFRYHLGLTTRCALLTFLSSKFLVSDVNGHSHIE